MFTRLKLTLGCVSWENLMKIHLGGRRGCNSWRKNLKFLQVDCYCFTHRPILKNTSRSRDMWGRTRLLAWQRTIVDLGWGSYEQASTDFDKVDIEIGLRGISSVFIPPYSLISQMKGTFNKSNMHITLIRRWMSSRRALPQMYGIHSCGKVK